MRWGLTSGRPPIGQDTSRQPMKFEWLLAGKTLAGRTHQSLSRKLLPGQTWGLLALLGEMDCLKVRPRKAITIACYYYTHALLLLLYIRAAGSCGSQSSSPFPCFLVDRKEKRSTLKTRSHLWPPVHIIPRFFPILPTQDCCSLAEKKGNVIRLFLSSLPFRVIALHSTWGQIFYEHKLRRRRRRRRRLQKMRSVSLCTSTRKRKGRGGPD